ncbi:MAG TPA: hypothetical protein VK254_01365, partial [Candidatus Bathyarchaeia archaeon]|nr:hypothetical protein [Candidatus Bathyarchaeia archaeon]
GFTSATLAVSPFTLSRYADSLLTLTPASLPYAKKKSKSRRETLIIQKFNLAKKAKKSWASVRVNGRKMKVSSVKNSGANLRIRFKLVYGKWAQGNYTLVMSYKNKVNNAWETGAFTGDNIFTVY